MNSSVVILFGASLLISFFNVSKAVWTEYDTNRLFRYYDTFLAEIGYEGSHDNVMHDRYKQRRQNYPGVQDIAVIGASVNEILRPLKDEITIQEADKAIKIHKAIDNLCHQVNRHCKDDVHGEHMPGWSILREIYGKAYKYLLTHEDFIHKPEMEHDYMKPVKDAWFQKNPQLGTTPMPRGVTAYSEAQVNERKWKAAFKELCDKHLTSTSQQQP